MRALFLVIILTMLASCASKPISAPQESEFYIGCIGGAIGRDSLTDENLTQQKVDIFDDMCRQLDQYYQTKTKPSKVEFPDLKKNRFKVVQKKKELI